MASRRTVTTTRETKVTSRRAGADEGAAPEAPKAGMGMGDAIAIVTFILLVGAFLVLDYNLGHNMKEGLFFKP